MHVNPALPHALLAPVLPVVVAPAVHQAHIYPMDNVSQPVQQAHTQTLQQAHVHHAVLAVPPVLVLLQASAHLVATQITISIRVLASAVVLLALLAKPVMVNLCVLLDVLLGIMDLLVKPVLVAVVPVMMDWLDQVIAHATQAGLKHLEQVHSLHAINVPLDTMVPTVNLALNVFQGKAAVAKASQATEPAFVTLDFLVLFAMDVPLDMEARAVHNVQHVQMVYALRESMALGCVIATLTSPTPTVKPLV